MGESGGEVVEEKPPGEESEKLKEEEDLNKKMDLEVVEKIQREGTIAVRESVLNELEEKHYSEQDKLYELIELTTPQQLLDISARSAEEQNERLGVISINRNKAREGIRSYLDSHPVEAMGEDEKKENDKVV